MAEQWKREGAPAPDVVIPIPDSSRDAAASFAELAPDVLGAVDLAIDGGELGGEPSTVVDISEIDRGGGWTVLREGALSAAAIAARLGGP